MSVVTRYDIWPRMDKNGMPYIMHDANKTGEFVLHIDHAILQASCDRYKAALEDIVREYDISGTDENSFLDSITAARKTLGE